jgi:nucleoside-diphosphate-sugar epimerase
MEFVIILLALVYGVGVTGNYRMLMQLVEYGFRLPLSNIRNKWFFIGIFNLVDLIVICISHPRTANQIFLASEDQDLSTNEFLRGLTKAMGESTRPFPFPEQVLFAAAQCVRKSPFAEKLLGSLQVDTSQTKLLLSWPPRVSLQDGLNRCFSKP